MGIMVRDRAAQYHESWFMEVQRRGVESGVGSELVELQQLQAEPRLPSGWEKCLDLKSGLIYFKDWNSGTLTYRDPRQSATLSTQRIGLMSISLSPEEVIDVKSPSNASARSVKRKTVDQFTSMVEHSLELSLNLPGTPSPVSRPGSSSQDGSVCTMEKVRSALERSPWLSQSHRLNLQMAKKKCSTGTPSSDPTKLLLASRPSSSSRKSSSPSRLHLESGSKSESAATSQCSSECFTSPSVMSFQGDDEEVQQPRECRDSSAKSQTVESENAASPVMVTLGCKSCLMYVMLSKSNPSCPKCGNTDVLLELPVPLPKKRRSMTVDSSPSWSWCPA